MQKINQRKTKLFTLTTKTGIILFSPKSSRKKNKRTLSEIIKLVSGGFSSKNFCGKSSKYVPNYLFCFEFLFVAFSKSYLSKMFNFISKLWIFLNNLLTFFSFFDFKHLVPKHTFKAVKFR